MASERAEGSAIASFQSSGTDDVSSDLSLGRSLMFTLPIAPPSNVSWNSTTAASAPEMTMSREPSDGPRFTRALGTLS